MTRLVLALALACGALYAERQRTLQAEARAGDAERRLAGASQDSRLLAEARQTLRTQAALLAEARRNEELALATAARLVPHPAAQGPHCLWVEGAIAPLGPYPTVADLYAAADSMARALPGQMVHVLGSVGTLVSPEPTPLWDGDSSLLRLVRPHGAEG